MTTTDFLRILERECERSPIDAARAVRTLGEQRQSLREQIEALVERERAVDAAYRRALATRNSQWMCRQAAIAFAAAQMGLPVSHEGRAA